VFTKPWIRELVLKQLEENDAQLRKAEYEFDNWVTLLTEDQIYEAGRNSNFLLHLCHYWTHVGGLQYVDFIGRVEDFEFDFDIFLSRVNIYDAGCDNLNLSEDISKVTITTTSVSVE
jgi:hypothetical protein